MTDDAVGEAVGLLQVLRREQHRGPVGDQLLDDVPQVAAAGRVEPGGRLVEEQHRRAVDERGGQVEPPAHAARVGASRPVGGVAEAEPLEQLVGPGPDDAPGQVREPADEAQVLAAGQVLVDRGVLAGEADALANGLGVAGHVDAEHLGPAVVGLEDGGEDAHGRRLAGAVGSEQAEHRAGRHGEVDAGQRLDGAEALGEALDPDGGGGGRGHGGDGCRDR